MTKSLHRRLEMMVKLSSGVDLRVMARHDVQEDSSSFSQSTVAKKSFAACVQVEFHAKIKMRKRMSNE